MKTFLAILLLSTALTANGIIETTNHNSDDSNTTAHCPHFEILRGSDGRDGRDGRDGVPGSSRLPGPHGAKGEPGQVVDGHGERGEKGEIGIQGAPGIQGRHGQPGPISGGVTYTRWGRTTCNAGSELVYSGRMGGSYYSHHGGAANHLCMPTDPEYTLYTTYTAGTQNKAYVYGTEYEQGGILSGLANHNAPCAVCFTPNKSAMIMIPAKSSCPSQWRQEYNGYLMSGYYSNNNHATMYECIDKDPESVPGSEANTEGALLYHVEASCNGLR